MRNRANLALLAAAFGSVFCPLPSYATCQSINDESIHIGMGRVVLRANPVSGTPDNLQYAKVFVSSTQGGYGTAGTSELNMGTNKTIGLLPAGTGFNLVIAAGVNDAHSGITGSGCVDAHVRVKLTAMNGDTCTSVNNGPWTSTYHISTCGFLDGVFRGLFEIGHFGIGFVPSYKIEVSASPLSTTTGTSDSGCFRVTQTGGASGCGETIN